MFENPRRGRQARNFTTNVPKILDLKSSSEQICSENWRWVPLSIVRTPKRDVTIGFNPVVESSMCGKPFLRKLLPAHYLSVSRFDFQEHNLTCFWKIDRCEMPNKFLLGPGESPNMGALVTSRLYCSAQNGGKLSTKQQSAFYLDFFSLLVVTCFLPTHSSR